MAALADDRRSGVWRRLQRLRLRDHLSRSSPDPDDGAKVAHRARCLREAARHPAAVVLRFLDERGASRWPDLARDGKLAAPGATARQVPTAGPTNRQQRLIGALNALTGPVADRHHSLVGRVQVCALYRRLDPIYATARRISVVQDNWSIHHHADVTAVLRQVPRIEPVWLPTDAPWLTPLEQLWHWLRRDVLTGHRGADDWLHLRPHGNAFRDQVAQGSPAVLRCVGLVGDGHLAYVLRSA